MTPAPVNRARRAISIATNLAIMLESMSDGAVSRSLKAPHWADALPPHSCPEAVAAAARHRVGHVVSVLLLRSSRTPVTAGVRAGQFQISTRAAVCSVPDGILEDANRSDPLA